MAESRDVVIIGGGVIGVASAYYLAKSGARVTLIERGQVGGGCSHGNCGYVCPSHVLPLAAPGAVWNTMKALLRRNSPLKVRPRFLLNNLGWFRRFARCCNETDMLNAAVGIQSLLNTSRSLYDELLAAESISCEWETQGLLFVFQSSEAFQHYAEVDKLLRDRFQMPADRFDAEALLELEPALKPGVAAGGYLYRSDAQLRPDRLMSDWRKVIERQGVVIHEHCEMQSFHVQNQQVHAVRTNQGEFSASTFVVATGAWTPLLNQHLGCQVPIIPGKGYSVTMPRPSICPKYPLIFEEHRVAVSPFQSGFRIGSTMEFGGYDDTLNRDRLRILYEGAQVYLREPRCESVLEEWWGWRPMVYDGKPIIDRSPAFGNVIIAAGHGMLGLSMATGTGKLVAQLASGQSPHVDPKHYTLERFR